MDALALLPCGSIWPSDGVEDVLPRYRAEALIDMRSLVRKSGGNQILGGAQHVRDEVHFSGGASCRLCLALISPQTFVGAAKFMALARAFTARKWHLSKRESDLVLTAKLAPLLGACRDLIAANRKSPAI